MNEQVKDVHCHSEDAFEWQAYQLWFLKKVRSPDPSSKCTAKKKHKRYFPRTIYGPTKDIALPKKV